MAATDVTRPAGATDRPGPTNRARRLITETKSALKTTELLVFLAVTVGVLIATAVVDEANAGGLGARQGWLYITMLAVGYMVSRGLAKSGSRDPYTDHDGDR